MLELTIDNLAVVEQLSLEPGTALNVLTGETGAGKSVLLGALGLALGGRASTDLVRTGAIAAAVEARFDGAAVRDQLVTEGIEPGDELVLRRTVHVRGAGRCEVNGRAVRLSTLRRLGAALVDRVGQHASHALLDPTTHRDMLDRFARAGINEMSAAWTELAEQRRVRDALVARAAGAADRADWLRHQLAELTALGLREGEIEEAEAEVLVLAHASEIASGCGGAHALLYERDGSAMEALAAAERELTALGHVDPRLGELALVLADARVLVEDVAREVGRRVDGGDDPGRLDALQARLEGVRQLARKHKVEPASLWSVASGLAEELDALDHLEQQLGDASVAVERAGSRARAAAAALHGARIAAAAILERRAGAELADLELPRARFVVAVTAEPESLGPAGWDQVAFELSANPGEPPRCLSRAASGGELSRVLLALTVVLQDAHATPTLVLDEIDAGLSGAAAQAVAVKLRQLAMGRQVLCITHLPVIAAAAATHFSVSKHDDGERTRAVADRLDGPGRVDEIARMVGGRAVTERTRAFARELLGDRGDGGRLRVVG